MQPPHEPELSRVLASYSPEGLLLRYARGRVAHFANRQILTGLGGLVLIVMNDLLTGLLAVALAVFGEAVDCLFLVRIRRLLAKDVSFRVLYCLSTLTAGLQAVTISACVALAWYGPVSHSSALFAIAFLAGAAMNAGLVLPFHRWAGGVRLVVYSVCGISLLVSNPLLYGAPDASFAMDVMGAVLLAYMVSMFLGFVNGGFYRQKANLLELTRQSAALHRTNTALRAQEVQTKRLALVAEHANDSIVVTSEEGRIQWVNKGFTRTTGYSFDEAVGQMPGDILNAPDTSAHAIADIAQAVQNLRPYRGEILNQRKDGTLIWVEVNLVPVQDEELGAITIAIERDISDAKQQAKELVAAKIAAEDGARAKAEFLATMSHEIRTPMNGIIGMADLLSETDLTGDQTLYADTIRTSAQALLTIINDVLDLSKLDAQKMSLSPVDFDLGACLAETVRLLQPQAEQKGIDLRLACAALPQLVHGDDGRLRQILINLIGNAVKFTERGSVTISAQVDSKPETHVLTVSVQDTGIGIPADKLKRIFERFSQADTATTRRFGGTGLGLTISKLLTEAMGGDILVSSTPGEGSCFTLRLLLGPATGVPRRETPLRDQSTDRFAGLKVLVAEDNKVNRLVIKKYLADVPVELVFAEDGAAAVEKTQRFGPDVIFMDMSMPVMNGLDATRHIRAQDGFQPTIVALTANAFASDKGACLEAGMDGFLTKAVRRAQFLECLARYGGVRSV